MADLTPVKRVDKNGVITTKHVRAEPRTKTAALPAPTPLGSRTLSTAVTASTVQKRWRVNKSKWGACDNELALLCTTRFGSVQTYECSDAEAYEVMSAVQPENALPLLSIGIRTAEAARRFLDETGVSRLKTNSTIIAEDAIVRKLPAREFLEFAGMYHRYTKNARFMDAAECWSIPAMKQVDYQRSTHTPAFNPLREMILEGDISWDDIKEIGIRTVANRATGTDHFVNHLVRLQNGTSGLNSASEIAEVLTDLNGSTSSNLDLADVYGLEGYWQLHTKDSWNASILMDAFRERDHSTKERFSIFQYSLRVGLNPEPKDIIALYEAGIAPEDARRGMVSKLTTNQIIGLYNGEVAPSVSSGYL